MPLSYLVLVLSCPRQFWTSPFWASVFWASPVADKGDSDSIHAKQFHSEHNWQHKVWLYSTKFLIDRVKLLLLNEFLYWTSAKHERRKKTSTENSPSTRVVKIRVLLGPFVSIPICNLTYFHWRPLFFFTCRFSRFWRAAKYHFTTCWRSYSGR
jgi:hypothetical protein